MTSVVDAFPCWPMYRGDADRNIEIGTARAGANRYLCGTGSGGEGIDRMLRRAGTSGGDKMRLPHDPPPHSPTCARSTPGNIGEDQGRRRFGMGKRASSQLLERSTSQSDLLQAITLI